jgi:hypothetical protein
MFETTGYKIQILSWKSRNQKRKTVYLQHGTIHQQIQQLDNI